MPIEFAPPQANLQGLNIQPPQYSDPLQTLAEMGQLRSQAIQRQGAEMALQQNQRKMQSQEGLMKAWQESGGDLEKMVTLAPQYGVLPDDLAGVQKHFADLAHTRAQTKLYGSQADKDAQEALDKKHDLLYNTYSPLQEEKDPAKQQFMLGKINQDLVNQGWNPKDLLPWNGPDTIPHAMAAYTTMNGIKTRAEAAEKEAQRKEAEARTTKLGLETADLRRNQAIAEIETAIDPDTGVPSPKEWSRIQQKYSDVQLAPGIPTAASVNRFIRSGVAVEKQPEFDIKSMQAGLGLLGNDKWDQYLGRYAQSIGKLPKDLNFPEFQKVAKQYATDTQNPELVASILAMRGTQQLLGQAQLEAMPPAEEIEASGADLAEGRVTPDQIREWRAGRIASGPKIIQAARRYAAAHNMPFNLANLEVQADTRLDTEKKFSTGPEAQMIRSFGNLMGHTGLLWDANEALGKNDLPMMQRIANALGTATGGDLQTTYDAIAAFVKDEAAKAFLPSGGSQGEREEKALLYGSNLGYQQRKNNIKTLMHLADEQRKGLEDQYEGGTFGKGQRQGKLFRAESLAQRDRILGVPQRAPNPPASIPANAIKEYSPSRKQWRYSTDGGKTWQLVPRTQQ